MGGNQAPRGWPLRLFRVVDDSMRPALRPGDVVVACRSGNPRAGEVRVFRDPTKATRWLVKRVGDVYRGEHGVTFDARSNNPNAPFAADSHDFGPITAAGSYRVVWTVHGLASPT